MKIANRLPINITKAILPAFTILLIAITSACKKTDGSLIAAKAVSIIQINANTTNYTLSAAPDVISFATSSVNSTTPTLRDYLVKGVNTAGTVGFALSFHTDTVGSGRYVFDGSQLIIGSKSYISLASKTADRISITKIDATNKLYTGSFSFWSFNQALTTDSVLVTGTYSIQQ